jgi:GTP-dependent phosphoenolpyruvate carboxykinase
MTKLWAIVSLNQIKLIAKLSLCFSYNHSGNTWSNVAMDFNIGHPAVQVNYRVDVFPALSERADVVNGVGLD